MVQRSMLVGKRESTKVKFIELDEPHVRCHIGDTATFTPTESTPYHRLEGVDTVLRLGSEFADARTSARDRV
jgi:hypothetical protein